MRNHARWGESPIGADLVVEDGGLTLTTGASTTLSRVARSSFQLADGVHGAEFMFWGDDPQQATIGICNGFAPLSAELGSASAIGWRLHAGQVLRNGTVIASGLAVPEKGEAVGVRIVTGVPNRVQFYRGALQVADVEFGIAGPFFFAASMATTKPRGLRCVVNAGQWQGLSPAVAAGWTPAVAVVAPIRLATEDYMTAAEDAPPNVPYRGVIASDGLSSVASVSFWMWETTSRQGTAQLRVQDGDGFLDAAALGDIGDQLVTVSRVVQGAALSTASPVATYVLDRIEVEDDSVKRLILKDAHSDLDEPLSRAVFIPSQGQGIAWQNQPAVIGVVRSVPGVSVNSDGSLQCLADTRLASVIAVRDRGAVIEAGSGFSLADDGQHVVFASPPLGPVTADACTLASPLSATLKPVLADIFSRLGKSAWSAADAQKIDDATGYKGIGFYGDQATPREALSEVLASYAADWWQDADGVLRLARLIDPDSVAEASLAFDLDWPELAAPLAVTMDLAPNLSRRMAYCPNAQQLGEGDLITDLAQLPPVARKELTSTHRGQVYSSADLASCYSHADGAAAVPSRFDRKEDAQAEIDRIVRLFAVPRRFYAGRLTGRPDLQFRPGMVGRLRYPRYGLNAGAKVIVTGAISNPVTGEHTLKFWGA